MHALTTFPFCFGIGFLSVISVPQASFAQDWDGAFDDDEPEIVTNSPLQVNVTFGRVSADVPSAPGNQKVRSGVGLYGLEIGIGVPVVDSFLDGSLVASASVGGRYPATVARGVNDLSAWIWVMPQLSYRGGWQLLNTLDTIVTLGAGGSFGRMSYSSASLATSALVLESGVRVGAEPLNMGSWIPSFRTGLRFEGLVGGYRGSGDTITVQSDMMFGPPTKTVRFGSNGDRSAITWQAGLGLVRLPRKGDTPREVSLSYVDQRVKFTGLREVNDRGNISRSDGEFHERGVFFYYSHGL